MRTGYMVTIAAYEYDDERYWEGSGGGFQIANGGYYSRNRTADIFLSREKAVDRKNDLHYKWLLEENVASYVEDFCDLITEEGLEKIMELASMASVLSEVTLPVRKEDGSLPEIDIEEGVELIQAVIKQLGPEKSVEFLPHFFNPFSIREVEIDD